MSGAPPVWKGELVVRVGSERLAGALERVLRPESAREVPRASVRVERAGPEALRLLVAAHDTGAMRAALNTYLGWIQLAVGTANAGGA